MSAILDRAKEQLEYDYFWKTGLDALYTTVCTGNPNIDDEENDAVMQEFYDGLGLHPAVTGMEQTVQRGDDRINMMRFKGEYSRSLIPFRGPQTFWGKLEYRPGDPSLDGELDRIWLDFGLSEKDHPLSGYVDFLVDEFQREYDAV